MKPKVALKSDLRNHINKKIEEIRYLEFEIEAFEYLLKEVNKIDFEEFDEKFKDLIKIDNRLIDE